jgi:methionyl-tRNA synthetase
MIREYLGADERIWDWEYIFEPLEYFIEPGRGFKFLEPRVDFFRKHPSQLN